MTIDLKADTKKLKKELMKTQKILMKTQKILMKNKNLKECKSCGMLIDKACRKCPACGRKFMGCFSYFIIACTIIVVLSYMIIKLGGA